MFISLFFRRISITHGIPFKDIAQFNGGIPFSLPYILVVIGLAKKTSTRMVECLSGAVLTVIGFSERTMTSQRRPASSGANLLAVRWLMTSERADDVMIGMLTCRGTDGLFSTEATLTKATATKRAVDNEMIEN